MSDKVNSTKPVDDYTIIEQMLPARVLLEIGIYLQTAAHIELTIWQIIMAAENSFTSDQDNFSEYLEVRKSTPKLVKRFRDCSSKCPPQLLIRVRALAERIEEGLINRNLAAHGAFFSHAQTGKIGVAHYFSVGQKHHKRWYEINEPINQRQIRNAIDDIDNILREAISIRALISSGESK